MAYHNAIKEALNTGVFLYTLEYVPDLRSSDRAVLDNLVRNAERVGRDPRIRGVNIGDRVKSTDSYDTVDCGMIAAEASGKVPLLHLAGKDREPHEAVGVIKRALNAGLTNLLLITGDRVLEPTRPGRTRYHESVIAITDAKRLAPDCVVAAAVSPFKYREEELINQYLKMAKKINAGANYLVTNCGWDMRKFEELIWYRDGRGFRVPLVANLLLPSLGWARGIHSKRLPGVHMSDDLFAKILDESKLGKQQAHSRYFTRLALQIVGVKFMGYAGVQLSGVESYESLCEVIELVEELEKTLTNREEWERAWIEAHTLPDGGYVTFAPAGAVYLFGKDRPAAGSLRGPPVLSGVEASSEEIRKYKRLSSVHQVMFDDHSIGAALLKPVFRAVNATALGKRGLLKLEHMTKAAILGCETCGFCRIEHLLYICPETCPKGLANGPCSGTDDNVCEFKDRECIHNSKYRIAKAVGRLPELEEVIVPAVIGTRMTSSWINHYNHLIPRVVRIPIRVAIKSGAKP